MPPLQALPQGTGNQRLCLWPGAPPPKSSPVRAAGAPQALRPRILLPPRQARPSATTGSPTRGEGKMFDLMYTSSRAGFVARTMIDGGSTSSRVGSTKYSWKETFLKLWEKTPPVVHTFPWTKACNRLLHQFKCLLWTVLKWVSVLAWIMLALSEIIYSVSVNSEFLIPVGLFTGTLIAGVLKETAMELFTELQDGGFPWHLVAIGAFFTLVKLSGLFLPVGADVFVLHLANGGLLQTIHFAIEWQKSIFKKSQAQ